MRAVLLIVPVLLLAVALVGCGGPGEANFHPDGATASTSSLPVPVQGQFYNQAGAATGNGNDISISVSADYLGTVSGNSSTFSVPITISNGAGTSLYSGYMTFNQTTATSGSTSTTVLNVAGYFGQVAVPFNNLADGTYTFTVSFPTEAGVNTQEVLWQQPLSASITVPLVTSNG